MVYRGVIKLRCMCCDSFMKLYKTVDNDLSNIEIYKCDICDKTLKVEKSYYGGFEITLNPSEYKRYINCT